MKRSRATALPVFLMIAALAASASAQKLTVPEVSRDKVICFALYTVQDNTLKLTAQLYPLKPGSPG